MRIVILLVVAAVAAGAQTAAKKKKKVVPAVETIVGCVDQKDGAYVLTDDRQIGKVASLEPDGFDRENFAKHVGHKVKLGGKSSGTGTERVFRVRTIQTIAEYCAPPA